MRRLASLLMLLPLSFLASCTAFDHEWGATEPPTTANPSAVIAGKWEGSWQSDATSYIGNLKAIIVPTETVMQDSGPVQKYRAQIKMTLYDVFSNEHAVVLTASPGRDGRMHFEGKVDRGTPFGGIYRYDGYVEDDKFFCDYTSDRDTGTFKMHRLTQELMHQ